MTILCANGCHVYRVGPSTGSGRCSARCTCGQAANGYPTPVGGMVYPFPNNYAPPRPPTAGAAPPVNIRVFRAAQLAGASHLSADGLRIYTVRYGETLEAEWKERLRDFGAWGVVAGMPGDAVAM